jgi:hypothetical protein
MKFLQNSDGLLHVGRIAGLVYLVSFLPSCREFPVVDPLCLMRMIFVAGWWLSFSAKRVPRTLRDMRPLGIIGLVLILFGVAGQFYFAGRH